jgi:hypothetical protein
MFICHLHFVFCRFSELFGCLAKRLLFEKDNEKLGAALYLEGLLTLLNMRAKDLNKGERGLPMNLPHGLRNKIFSAFTKN